MELTALLDHQPERSAAMGPSTPKELIPQVTAVAQAAITYKDMTWTTTTTCGDEPKPHLGVQSSSTQGITPMVPPIRDPLRPRNAASARSRSWHREQARIGYHPHGSTPPPLIIPNLSTKIAGRGRNQLDTGENFGKIHIFNRFRQISSHPQ